MTCVVYYYKENDVNGGRLYSIADTLHLNNRWCQPLVPLHPFFPFIFYYFLYDHKLGKGKHSILLRPLHIPVFLAKMYSSVLEHI